MAVFFASEAVYLAQRSSTLGRSIYVKIARIFFSAANRSKGVPCRLHKCKVIP